MVRGEALLLRKQQQGSCTRDRPVRALAASIASLLVRHRRRSRRVPAGAPAEAARAPIRAGDLLAHVPLFAGLESSLRESLAARTRALRLDAGDWLFREGDRGEAMYIVRTGRLEVVDETADVVIRQLGRGDALGELALLSDSPRSASVRAVRASHMLAVDRGDFEALSQSSLALSPSLCRVLAAQLRDGSATPV